jgi:outer membrane protein assembly factor BamB
LPQPTNSFWDNFNRACNGFVTQGTFIYTDSKCILTALDKATGALVWTLTTPEGGFCGAMAAGYSQAADVLVLSGAAGSQYAYGIAASSGQILWRIAEGNMFTSLGYVEPQIAGTSATLLWSTTQPGDNPPDGIWSNVDLATGQENWRIGGAFSLPRECGAASGMGATLVNVDNATTVLQGVDLADGTVRWRGAVQNPSDLPVMIGCAQDDGGNVYVVLHSPLSNMQVYDGATGKFLRALGNIGWEFNPVLLVVNNQYVCVGDNPVICNDVATGAQTANTMVNNATANAPPLMYTLGPYFAVLWRVYPNGHANLTFIDPGTGKIVAVQSQQATYDGWPAIQGNYFPSVTKIVGDTLFVHDAAGFLVMSSSASSAVKASTARVLSVASEPSAPSTFYFVEEQVAYKVTANW